ncbi:MAG: C39 family peptidase [Pseudomonadota bacterium]|nr:C39 family peptidase [Pseudomonadota bacterium]
MLGFVCYVRYHRTDRADFIMRTWTPIALILSATAGAPLLAAERGPVKSLLEMRQDRVVVQKWDLSCGAAALATLLNYQHGDLVAEREIARVLIQRREYLADPLLVRVQQGFSLLDLKRYVDRRGYEGIGYGRLTLRDLIEQAPIMVPVSLHGYNHFVVFRGRRGDRVLIADPAWGNRTLRVERFEEAWIDSPEIGKVGFVVVQRGGSTPPNRLAPRASDFVMLR